MNAVWIILWVSSQPVVVNDRQIAVELADHSSVRDTQEAAIAWKRELRSQGVGLNFQIYKCELFEEERK